MTPVAAQNADYWANAQTRNTIRNQKGNTMNTDNHPQDVADDLDDLGPQDYAVAASTLAQEATQAQEGTTEAGTAEAPALDGVDPGLANHITKLRRENAEKRTAAAELEAENGTLKQWQQDRMRRDVENLAAGHKMLDPSEFWHKADLADVLGEDGQIDEAKVAAIVEAKVPSHWRVQPRSLPGRGGQPSSGATGIADVRTPSWSEALGRPQE